VKILVAFEKSGKVRELIQKNGHEVYSCDLEPSNVESENHLQQDVIPLLSKFWDMIIAFPPCTDLASSGARWFKEKIRNGSQKKSVELFLKVTRSNSPRLLIENPIGIMSTIYRKPDQIIQPWEFGHGETKATCLWLKGLPLLKPTKIVPGREQRIWKMPPGPDRAWLRSETYDGIADAIAQQYAPPLRASRTPPCEPVAPPPASGPVPNRTIVTL